MSRDPGMKSRACRPGTPDSAPWVSTLGLHRMRCKRVNARHAVPGRAAQRARGGASNTDVRISRAGVPGRRGMRSGMKVLVR